MRPARAPRGPSRDETAAGPVTRTVVVGLLAVPPDHPAALAELLTRDLAGLLAERVDDRVRWDIRTGWGDQVPAPGAGLEGLLTLADECRVREGWDLVICLTDLPLYIGRTPLVAHASAARRSGLVCLPALGVGQRRSARRTIAALVEWLSALGPESERPAGTPPPRLVEAVRMIRRAIAGHTDGEIGFIAGRWVGRPRLLIGMVRANRPSRAILGLSKLLVAALGTAALALTTETIWQMGDASSGGRLALLMMTALVALVGYLIIGHELWEWPSETLPRSHARLFNLCTTITLAIAVCVSYVGLFIATFAAAELLIAPSMLQGSLHHPVGHADYAALAWIVSTLATAGGAVGSGLENEQAVRAAAYGFHPDPRELHARSRRARRRC
ncbi:hypothetical protein [Pseudonocardia acidicola]|uniref:hypothetical protein n=1 Tax=Pseudonocardia acidicola TaxID=2724939 RepID=UPI001B7CE56F|nr:hypothetical protein [Pseudonocardia acidicola]